MATLLSLPLELRLQIYRELFSSKPRASHIGQHTSATVSLYSDRTFCTAILHVNKQVYEEAVSILYGETVWTLHVYLIFRGDKYHGPNLGDALHSLTHSKLFHYIRICILDVRLFRDQSKEDTTFYGTETLRDNVKIVRRVLSRARGLQKVEVSWRNYLMRGWTEQINNLFEPLDRLTVKYKIYNCKMEDDVDGFKDSASWPDMLKAYRVVMFGRAYSEEKKCVERDREGYQVY